ncbi:MAG: hypothetical protein K9H49_14830 [Bacteroidales bacterium]|nr:hypothetical protein [Bacteroidales bacterium]MCF8390636.1 hypothetical protein [Bacteroidales bacterium]
MKKQINIFKIILVVIGIMSISTLDSFGNYLKSSKDSSGISGPVLVKEFPLELIAPSMGLRFYKNGIIFPSASKVSKRMPANHLSFGLPELYYAELEDSLLGSPVVFSATSSLSFPVDGMSFSSDFSEMYYSEVSKTDGKEKIYKASNLGGDANAGWGFEDQPLSFCEENFIFSHPALSNKGDFMIFASDKNGSGTGMDLFISRMKDGKWGNSESLSKVINSKGNEFYPFLDADNNLFFSSDGLPGYGGFDIYCSKYNGKEWDAPVNLTKRINSNQDEMAFTLDRKERKTGFVSKGVSSANGDIKLYKLSLTEEYQKSGMDLASLLVNLALLEGDTPITMAVVPDIKTEEKKPEPETKKAEPKNEPEKQKEEVKPEVIEVKETKQAQPQVQTTVTAVKPTVAAETKPQTTETKPEIIQESTKLVTQEPKKDEVIYRVQFASSSTSKGSYTIKVDGKDYKTWEYFYKGAYRSCVGELKSLSEAKIMQTKCRQSGHPQAFVVVFVNDERSLDPGLFR